MRILTLSTHDVPCGIATYNHSLMHALRASGVSVEVHPIDSSYLESDSEAKMRKFISRFLDRGQNFDALVIQHEHGLFHGRFPPRVGQKMFSKLLSGVTAMRKPTVAIFHSEPLLNSSKRLLSRKRFIETRIKNSFNRCASLLAAVHGRDGKQKYLAYGLRGEKIWQIEHPFPDPDPLPETGVGGSVTLTIFGFVSDYKGYAEAIAALTGLPRNYHLCVAGGSHPTHHPNSLLERLVRQQESGPLAGRIRVTGWLSDGELRSVMQETSIVLACYHENGPVASGAVTWGIAYGRPVIASDTPTFRRIEEEAQCFQLVPPKDTEALKQSILRLSGDGELKRRMVENGLSYAGRHSWSALADDLLRKFKVLGS